MTDETPVRIAQYGISHAHASGHAAVLKTNPDVDFCGVFEPSEALRETRGKADAYRGLHWFETKDEMLQDASIQAIAIEGAVHENLAFAREAIECGKHLWLDKPAGDDFGAFREIVEIARQNGLLCQLGYMFRYNDAFQRVLTCAEKGWFGDIFAIRGRMSTSLGPEQCRELARHRGGILFELLCHLIDIVTSLLGRPEAIRSHLRNDLGVTPDFADNTVSVFDYGRAVAILESAAMEVEPFPVRRFEVYGSKGSAIIEPLEPPRLRLCFSEPHAEYAKGWNAVAVENRPRYVDDVIALVAAIRGEKEPDRSLDHELLVQETVLRASSAI